MRGESTKRNIEIAAQYREAVVGSGIALSIEAANFLFFEHNWGGTQLAINVAILGILLAVLRSAMQSFVQDSLEPVNKMTKIMDLQNRSNISSLDSLLSTYLSITEPEFSSVKDQAVADVNERLRRLANTKRSDSLQSLEYYHWIFQQFETLKKGDWVHAISLSSIDEWNDSQLERNFLNKNIEAASRGVIVERIFILDRSELSSFIQLPPIKAHLVESGTKLAGYFIDLQTLSSTDPELLKSVGQGILDFNGRVGLEDKFSEAFGARGEVTMNSADLDRMEHVFQRLRLATIPLDGALAGSTSEAV